MMAGTPRPAWVTFDCYGTLIQWDEGLLAAASTILARRGARFDAGRLIPAYDRHEHALEQREPHRRFKDIAAQALGLAMEEFGMACEARDAATLTEAIGAMPPFPEVLETLGTLRRAGLRLCIISNIDDAIMARTLRQLGGHIERVVTAEQAGAYKPSTRIFDVAHEALGVTRDATVHVCASPQLDLVATRALGIRDIWIDRRTGRRPPPGCEPAATLPSLDRLPALFRDLGWI